MNYIIKLFNTKNLLYLFFISIMILSFLITNNYINLDNIIEGHPGITTDDGIYNKLKDYHGAPEDAVISAGNETPKAISSTKELDWSSFESYINNTGVGVDSIFVETTTTPNGLYAKCTKSYSDLSYDKQTYRDAKKSTKSDIFEYLVNTNLSSLSASLTDTNKYCPKEAPVCVGAVAPTDDLLQGITGITNTQGAIGLDDEWPLLLPNETYYTPGRCHVDHAESSTKLCFDSDYISVSQHNKNVYDDNYVKDGGLGGHLVLEEAENNKEGIKKANTSALKNAYDKCKNIWTDCEEHADKYTYYSNNCTIGGNDADDKGNSNCDWGVTARVCKKKGDTNNIWVNENIRPKCYTPCNELGDKYGDGKTCSDCPDDSTAVLQPIDPTIPGDGDSSNPSGGCQCPSLPGWNPQQHFNNDECTPKVE